MQQPFLHDLIVTLAAPVQVWSRRDGTFDGRGVSGVFCGDRRVLAGAAIMITDADGQPIELEALGLDSRGGTDAAFTAMVRVASEGADPLVSLARYRHVTTRSVSEEITIASALEDSLTLRVQITFSPDATPLNLIKAGAVGEIAFDRDGASWTWGPGTSAVLDADGATWDADHTQATWTLVIEPNRQASVRWRLEATDADAPFTGFAGEPLRVPALDAPVSATITQLVRRSVADLNALRLAPTASPDHGFVAAGAPWFLTLFGRDSLISARLFLPAGRELALDTLTILARLQGRATDPDTAEAPGKILHEVRAESLDLLEGTVLPPLYYGTIDATCLWIILLGQVWHAGATRAEIEPLLDALVAALGWLRDSADPDGDGFLEYHDLSGHGLTNQGWKDSGDAVRFADGTIAQGPIALAEVQGYAYQAARMASELLGEFGRTEAERASASDWDAYADAMAVRFRERFWVSDAHGRYPALALDADKRPVDGVASNMGHLLVTGMLDADEQATIVERLMSPAMFSGYGIRTMSTENGRYWPTRYHVGSVWTHDTAMAIEGMLATGFTDEAAVLARGLLRASEGFGGQLPELFGGQDAATAFPPTPYPASCHPQAWAAASSITIARALGVLSEGTQS